MDGLRLKCKEKTKQNRDDKRERYGVKHEEWAQTTEDSDDPAQLAVYKKYSEEITRENYYMFIDFLKHKGVDFIIAPYEADSQLAYLYHNGYIDYILTEDSDLIAYGCFNIIRCLKKNGDCKLLKLKSKAKKNMSPALKMFLELDRVKQTQCCILAGCDYLPNIKGLGFSSLIRIFSEHCDVWPTIRKFATGGKNRIKTVKEFVQYKTDFENAFLAFTEQLVYCPKRERIVNLSSRTASKKQEALKLWNTDYIGKPIVKAKEFSKGIIDFDRLSKMRKANDIDFDRILKFFEYRPDFSSGRIGNLTVQLVTFDNFDQGKDAVDKKAIKREDNFLKRNKIKRWNCVLGADDDEDAKNLSLSPGASTLTKTTSGSKRVKSK